MPPATSQRQANLFRLAYALKSGADIKVGGAARRIARTVSKKKIKKFMVKKNG